MNLKKLSHQFCLTALLMLSQVATATSPVVSAHTNPVILPAVLENSLEKSLEKSISKAQELAALPGGAWLALEKQALRLFDARGKQLAQLPMRAKHLDTRPHAEGALAMVLDADTQRPLPILVNLSNGTLQVQAAFPEPAFSVETMCLYRDAQQLDYLFLLGKNGLSEQWVMQGDQRKLVRKLALPAQANHCRSDDLTHTLFVSESKLGLWAYAADPEGVEAKGLHQPLLLRARFGHVQDGTGTFAVLPGGLAVLDSKGEHLHLLRQHQGIWKQLPVQRLPYKHEIAQMSLRQDSSGIQLLLRDEQTKSWHVRTIAWSNSSAVQLRSQSLPPVMVQPKVQTDPVARYGDAADDPAIWVHHNDNSLSRVLATNKKQGLLVYDLQGKQRQLLESGRLNNVDLRQNVRFSENKYDLAVATQRDENSLVVYEIAADGEVNESARIATDFDKIYGTCLYQPVTGGLEVFVNNKDGRFQQIRIERSEQGFTGRVVRQFKVDSQPEGCVADDRNDQLYLGEEKRGIWLASAKAESAPALRMIVPVGEHLKADVEGMAIYYGAKHDYLIVSSQGDSSYLVLDAKAPYGLRGKFKIGINLASGIDGTSETDGLDVSSANFGAAFSTGMLVVQDGNKRLPDGPQNFKYVAWDDIAKALKLPE